MSPEKTFVVAFAATLALLGAVTWTGMRARRRAHLVFVVLTVSALAWTIRCALDLGKVYDLASAGVITPIHLTLAKINTVAFLVPVVTGVRAWFVPAGIRLHKKVAWAVLALTVVCAITGTIMILSADRRPA